MGWGCGCEVGPVGGLVRGQGDSGRRSGWADASRKWYGGDWKKRSRHGYMSGVRRHIGCWGGAWWDGGHARGKVMVGGRPHKASLVSRKALEGDGTLATALQISQAIRVA